MRAPGTVAEFLDLLDQAIFETDELGVCAEEDLDDELSDLSDMFAGISHSLRALKAQVEGGEHQFANDRDLVFMRLAHTYRHVIPFYPLFDALNRAHRNGLPA